MAGEAMAGGALTIAHVDAETGFSGGEVQVFLLLEGLRRRGHRSVLFAPPGSRAELEARARGIEAVAVPMRADLDAPGLLRLAAGFKRVRPSIVHLHTGRATWLGGLAARLCGLPAVATRRQDKPLSRGRRARFVYGSLVRRAAAISPAVQRRLEEGGVAPERVRLIPSAVDPLALAPLRGRDATRAALGLGQDEVVLVVLAQLVPRKGVDVLLEALALLPAAERPALLVAGEGSAKAALEAQASRLALRGVRFLGERRDKGDLLAASDLFVLPSRAEGLGVAALEAMAAGRAVVASAVGGLGEAVADGETGLLVPPDDPRALAAALKRLCNDGELRRRLGAAGPARVANGHHVEAMVSAYEALYREVLALER